MKTPFLLLLMLVSTLLFGQWTTDTVSNSLISSYSNGAVSKAVPGFNGSCYISYYGSMFGGYNMNLQYVDYYGQKQWAENGITVSDHGQDSWIADYAMNVDTNDDAIVCFADIRNGDPDIFVYKHNEAGEPLWGEDGICLSNSAEYEYSPAACVLNDNSVIVSWVVGDAMKVQKISVDGTLEWGVEGLLITETGKSFGWPVPLPDDDGGFYLAYFKQTGSYPALIKMIYVQRFNADGTMVWDEDVQVCGNTGISSWSKMYARKDHENGVLIYWRDDRFGDLIPDVEVQRVNAAGNPVFIPNGVTVSSDGLNCYYPAAASLNDGTVMVFFTKTDGSQNYRGMYVQKLDLFGELMLGPNGKELFPLTSEFNYTIDMQAHVDNAFCLYSVFPQGMATNEKFFIYALDEDGNDLWNEPLPIAVGEYSKVHPWLSRAFGGQFVVTWESGDNGHVFAQNFTTSGETGVIWQGINRTVQQDAFRIRENIITIEKADVLSLSVYDMMGRAFLNVDKPAKGQEIAVNNKGFLFITSTRRDGSQHVTKVYF